MNGIVCMEYRCNYTDGGRPEFFEKNQPQPNVLRYTECNRRNGPDFGRVFLMLN